MGNPEIKYIILFNNYTRLKKKLDMAMNALYEIAYPAYFAPKTPEKMAREKIQEIEGD